MINFIKRYFVLVVVAALFAGAFLLSLSTGEPEKTEADYGMKEDVSIELSGLEDIPTAAEDYFETFRREREEVRELEMQYLDEVIAVSATDAETLADAQSQKMTLVENMEKEFTIESLVKAKGFEDAAVTFHAGTVNVVVKSEALSSEQVAQILDIVQKETGETADNIKVMTDS